tara:strand:- start:484 stop:744 length:261 start_codon:yes stop_codon:yes gene_type:complete
LTIPSPGRWFKAVKKRKEGRMTLSTIDVPVDLARSLERYRREHDTLSKILYLGDARVRETVKHFLADYRLKAIKKPVFTCKKVGCI